MRNEGFYEQQTKRLQQAQGPAPYPFSHTESDSDLCDLHFDRADLLYGESEPVTFFISSPDISFRALSGVRDFLCKGKEKNYRSLLTIIMK